jgi:hypothetical protein
MKRLRSKYFAALYVALAIGTLLMAATAGWFDPGP